MSTKLDQIAKKRVKKTPDFDHLGPDSNLKLLTPEEVAAVIGKRAEQLRRLKRLRQADTGLSQSTFSNFANKGQISLDNLVRVMRALGKEEELEALLKPSLNEQIALAAEDVDQMKRIR